MLGFKYGCYPTSGFFVVGEGELWCGFLLAHHGGSGNGTL